MFHADLQDGLGIVLVMLQLGKEGPRDAGPADLGETAELGVAGHGHDAGEDGDVDPRAPRPLQEAEVVGVVEEELGDGEVQPRLHLGLEVAEVGLEAPAFRVAFGVGRPAHGEGLSVALPDEATSSAA